MNNKLINLLKKHECINIFIKFLNRRTSNHNLYTFFTYTYINRVSISMQNTIVIYIFKENEFSRIMYLWSIWYQNILLFISTYLVFCNYWYSWSILLLKRRHLFTKSSNNFIKMKTNVQYKQKYMCI